MTHFSKKEIMTEEEFGLFRDLVEKEFGILLKGDRRLTLHTKVAHRLVILGLATYRDYYDYIRSDASRHELDILASHITNNETYFFRERGQLDYCGELLQEIKREKQGKEQRIRILSLASSSGEEAYSLSIIVHECGFLLWNWDIKIVGIDIDRSAVKKAVAASYTSNSFRTTDSDSGMLEKYFTVAKGQYDLKKSYTRIVEFRQGNLLDASAYRELAPVDVIFCRNVLIYLSDAAIGRLARNLYEIMSPSGYLFIGASESLIQKTNLFLPEYARGVIVYRKNMAATP